MIKMILFSALLVVICFFNGCPGMDWINYANLHDCRPVSEHLWKCEDTLEYFYIGRQEEI